MNSPLLTVVLPAYREEQTILQSLGRLFRCLDDYGITFLARLVVDGPGDRTAELARTLEDPRLAVIELDQNFGKGKAIRVGMEGCSTPYLAYIDADLDLHPEGLAEAFRALENAPEFVCGAVGSKVHPMSRVDYPLPRRILSRIFKWLVRWGFSIDVNDTQTGLKVFRANHVLQVLPHLESNGFEFDLELLTRLSRRGLSFIEIPIDLDYHFASTVNVRSGVRTLTDMLALALHLRRVGRHDP